MIWKTRNGQEIDIKDMTTSHLQNTIAMLKRKGVVTPDTFDSCLAYTCHPDTPDGACMAAESELAQMIPWKGLALLEEELASRKTDG